MSSDDDRERSPFLVLCSDALRAVKRVLIERGKTDEEVERYYFELFTNLGNQASRKHYTDKEPRAAVDEWYARRCIEKLAGEGFAGVLPTLPPEAKK